MLALTNEHDGPMWALAQLATGAAGSVVVTEMGKRFEPEPPAEVVPVTPRRADEREHAPAGATA